MTAHVWWWSLQLQSVNTSASVANLVIDRCARRIPWITIATLEEPPLLSSGGEGYEDDARFVCRPLHAVMYLWGEKKQDWGAFDLRNCIMASIHRTPHRWAHIDCHKLMALD
ncbi:hypothetical protein EDC04DRAFT_279549 [Pisolithus marmoratus]|nr:hypothetical protein EDC04DRAFT_279549 [Pisolithus marmoratus]